MVPGKNSRPTSSTPCIPGMSSRLSPAVAAVLETRLNVIRRRFCATSVTGLSLSKSPKIFTRWPLTHSPSHYLKPRPPLFATQLTNHTFKKGRPMGKITLAVAASHAPGLVGMLDAAPEQSRKMVLDSYGELARQI